MCWRSYNSNAPSILKKKREKIFIIFIFIFLDCFDVLVSKINIKKLKNILFKYIFKQKKYLEKQPSVQCLIGYKAQFIFKVGKCFCKNLNFFIIN